MPDEILTLNEVAQLLPLDEQLKIMTNTEETVLAGPASLREHHYLPAKTIPEEAGG